MSKSVAELMAAIKDRRKHRKLVYIGEEWIRKLIQVPDDVVIEQIYYDQVRQTFVLVCNNLDWPEVAEYCEPPSVLGYMTPVKVKSKELHNGTHHHELIFMKLDLDWNGDR